MKRHIAVAGMAVWFFLIQSNWNKAITQVGPFGGRARCEAFQQELVAAMSDPMGIDCFRFSDCWGDQQH
jgi:hypothetical protein